jgi:phosphotriesterase-related protein
VSELKGKVQTVLGPIDPAQLGPTLMHEHLLTDFTPFARRPEYNVPITLENRYQMDYDWPDAPGNRWLLDRDVATREMQRLHRDGGRTLVEVSIEQMVIDPEGLRLVAERTGMHIIRGVGRYIQEFLDEAEQARGVDAIVKTYIHEIRNGHADTGIKAGLIGEIGSSWPWTEPERRSMQAAVIAQQETGACLTIHPGRSEAAPFEILEFVKTAGADLTRTIMDHIERRLFSIDDMLRLADSGITLEFDTFGWECSRFAHGVSADGTERADIDPASDGVRVTAIRRLIDAGHLDRIVISHDIGWRTRQAEFGGHGYGHIFRNVVPMMRRRGFTEAEVTAILVRNPARLLTFV